ncbi:OmpA/MotB family protein [Pseudodesulfovibrio sp.]|uniref:OmpA/MotB family protein n=1 Tax=unclassified Pseudodesulfovibrio TaxID=2661612 RepID=UPI003B006AAE
MRENSGQDLFLFDADEGDGGRGMQDWAVPWSDLMMVMFVLFVVLFVYASTHQDVKVLFSRNSADKAQATSTLDPLIGLIGQISSRADGTATSDTVRMAGNQVVYRSRGNGVTVIRENGRQVRVILRGKLFFAAGQSGYTDGAEQYLQEIADVVRLSVGTVHIIGYASADEAGEDNGFALSSGRATDTARYLMDDFGIDSRRIVITGAGANRPEIPGTTADSLSRNRRVEIVITNKM